MRCRLLMKKFDLRAKASVFGFLELSETLSCWAYLWSQGGFNLSLIFRFFTFINVTFLFMGSFVGVEMRLKCWELVSAPIFILLSLLQRVEIQTLAIPLGAFWTLTFGVDIEKNLWCIMITNLDLGLVWVLLSGTSTAATWWLLGTIISLVWLTVLFDRSCHFTLPTASSTTFSFVHKFSEIDIQVHASLHLNHALFRHFHTIVESWPLLFHDAREPCLLLESPLL